MEELKLNQIYQGDCLDVLKTFPDLSVNCCITSPPYYALRDYGTGKWIGGDPNCPHKRISKYSPDTITGHKQDELIGNVGDAIYKNVCPLCGAVREDKQIGLEETPEEYIERLRQVFHEVKRILKDDGTLWVNIGDSYNGAWNGAKQKDLIGIPWMLAFALRADGWYLRQDIIWHKPNPMPEPVKDRCTKSHEYIFLLSKSPQYYFDGESISEPITESSIKRLSQNQMEFVEFMRSRSNPQQIEEATGINRTTIDHWFRKDKEGFAFPSADDWKQVRDYVNDWSREFERIDWALTFIEYESDEIDKNCNGRRNKRDVWTITPSHVKEAHFATYPEELVEPCILAGCPEGGTDLDPFLGSGTTGRVAESLNRRWVGVELNPEYIEIANRRINNIQTKLII